MRVMIAAAALLFVAMIVVIVVKLSSDVLPPRHLEVQSSAYFRTESGTARLVLVVLDVAPDGMVVPRVLPHEPGQAEATVEIVAAQRAPDQSKPHGGRVVLDIAVPVAKSLVVVDRRWDHPKEHPQGYRFRMGSPPPDWKSK